MTSSFPERENDRQRGVLCRSKLLLRRRHLLFSEVTGVPVGTGPFSGPGPCSECNGLFAFTAVDDVPFFVGSLPDEPLLGSRMKTTTDEQEDQDDADSVLNIFYSFLYLPNIYCSRYASMNKSMSPSSTLLTFPVSTFVRWSLTIL